MHVAKALWGVRKLGVDPHDAMALGKAYAAGAAAFEDDANAKTEITDINKKIYERSDSDINALYDTGRAASLAAFEEVYTVLGTQFDHYFFESVVGPLGIQLVQKHPEVFPESDGARVFRGEEYGLHTRVFINNKGLPTYEAKELGLAQEKLTVYPNADALVVVTGNEISEYFKVVKKAMELVIPTLEGKITHVPHGMLRLTSGKMSSRTGSIIAGKDLIDDMATAAAHKPVAPKPTTRTRLPGTLALVTVCTELPNGSCTLMTSSGNDGSFFQVVLIGIVAYSEKPPLRPYPKNCTVSHTCILPILH
jgi:arginyl-tRNA synthetase